ncbi:GST-like protein [Litoreibacter ponti]|uniref:GST-like protein n=1 Tax=Litoreibacter ponti TaxID=1510457 RepID=A0A2T6BL08_9RHOB|nr:glutathione S-transferase family protein [Litoreibacter ponti]PTX56739.1 GST-like protein [Litoreibacter ponti]
MIKFYFHTTPNPFKVALMLEELGVAYETIPVDTRKGEQHLPDFLAINPNAKLPAMVDEDGTVIFDSNAMVLHLAQKHGKFLPAGHAAMGEMLSWYFFIATGLSPFSGQAVHFTRAAPDEAYARNRYTKEITRHYKVLDDRLARSEWVGGADYSIADIIAWGWVRMAGFVMEADGGLANFPNVQAWFDKVDARPAATRATALQDKHSFKQEMDEVAMRAMFPQNFD